MQKSKSTTEIKLSSPIVLGSTEELKVMTLPERQPNVMEEEEKKGEPSFQEEQQVYKDG
jgi:hypothetical protein